MPTNVLIIVINWQHYDLTISCLKGLRPQASEGDAIRIQIVVIENGSSNESLQKLIEFTAEQFSTFVISAPATLSDSPNITSAPSDTELFIIKSPHNTGFSGGVNLGAWIAQALNPEFCLLLNNDADLPRETLASLIDVSKKNNNAIVGPVLYPSSTATSPYFLGKLWPWFLFGIATPPPSVNGLRKSAYVEGSCMLIPMALLALRQKENGYVLDDQMFLYCEDVDLCLFAAQKGVPSIITESARAYHAISKSAGGQGNSTAYYYITRNRVLIAKKWLSIPMRWLFLCYYFSSRIVLIILRWIMNGRTTAKAIAQGLFDALTHKWGKKELR